MSDSEEFFDAKESPTTTTNAAAFEEKPTFIDLTSENVNSRKSSFQSATSSRQNSPTKPARHFLKPQSSEESPFSRQRKLNHLRQKMRSEFDADSPRQPVDAVVGLGFDAENSLDSLSEVSSLASWGKHLLIGDNSRKSDGIVVTAMDTVSTKAVQQPLQSFPLKFFSPPPMPAAAASSSPVTVAEEAVAKSSSSSASQSTESSKNSTLERFVTPESKSSSLERNLQISRSLGSKTSSLTRDISGLSACDQFYFDNAQLAVLERKNSAATEVIEALTSEIVRNVKIERSPLQKSAEKLSTSPIVVKEEPIEVVKVVVASSPPNGVHRVSECEDAASAVAKGGTLKKPKEPDIITSNRVRLDLNVDSSCPPKPPRRRKRLGSCDTPSTPGSPIAPDHKINQATNGTDLPDSVPLNDEEILQATMLKNLDTGEQMPLIVASEKVQTDPLKDHMKSRIKSDNRNSRLSVDSDSASFVSSEDVPSVSGSSTGAKSYIRQAKHKTLQYKKILGKRVGRAVNKMRRVAEGVSHQFHNNEETSQSEEEDNSDNNKIIRIRASHKHKGPYHFEQIKLAQDLTGEHSGAVWCLKFSHCGRLLATAGQDNLIRVWVLKDAFHFFNEMRSRYNAEEAIISGVPFHEQLLKCAAEVALIEDCDKASMGLHREPSDVSISRVSSSQDEALAPFCPKPFCIYRGHSADVLDLSLSKNYFILSSSMDRTVRLWHISRTECLCCFQHIDFVTAIAFLPKDDRYFLSGSLDGKLRLWHIPEKKVALWNEVDGGKLVTTLTFARNGKFAVVGTYDGRCIFYSTEQLKYHTQIDVKSSHGKNSRPHKVTGLEAYQDKLLVTSNDSRIRLYDLRDLSLTCKYKGYTNYESRIRASFSSNGKYIVCGSEDRNVYIWKTTMDSDTLSLPVRKDRNRLWESIRAHNAVVTAAVFAPRPDVILKQIDNAKKLLSNDSIGGRSSSSAGTRKSSPTLDPDVSEGGEVLVSADFNGAIHVFINKAKVKTGSSTFLPSY